MSFLDNLENNLKALESRDQGGLEDARQRDIERQRALAIAPWADRLRHEPFARKLMQQATSAGYRRRTKVNLAWIGQSLRLEARGQKLELRPASDGVDAVFLDAGAELGRKRIDLSADPEALVAEWMALLDGKRA